MTTSHHDPKLIFALTRSLLEREGEKIISPQEPMVYLYCSRTPGRYMIVRGNLYYDDDPSDGHYSKSNKAIEALEIKHVLIEWGNRYKTKTYSWPEFCAEIKL